MDVAGWYDGSIGDGGSLIRTPITAQDLRDGVDVGVMKDDAGGKSISLDGSSVTGIGADKEWRINGTSFCLSVANEQP